jgi:hypothetical protein
MIAVLLAAQLSAAALGAPAADLLPGLAQAPLIRPNRSGPPKACSGSTRLQTSAAQPMLLFREQDRAAARPRKLAELPPAEICLAGLSRERPK